MSSWFLPKMQIATPKIIAIDQVINAGHFFIVSIAIEWNLQQNSFQNIVLQLESVIYRVFTAKYANNNFSQRRLWITAYPWKSLLSNLLPCAMNPTKSSHAYSNSNALSPFIPATNSFSISRLIRGVAAPNPPTFTPFYSLANHDAERVKATPEINVNFHFSAENSLAAQYRHLLENTTSGDGVFHRTVCTECTHFLHTFFHRPSIVLIWKFFQ